MDQFSSGKNIKYLVSPTTYTVSNDDDVIEVNTSGGGITTITLQTITISDARKPIYINDASGNAAAANIIVMCSGGNLINNSGILTLDSDGISAQIVVADRNRYIANLNTDTGGGGGGSTYTNPNPMPSTIGGYPAGTTFPTPQTMQQMWDGLLYPYQYPALGITNALFQTYEIGQFLPSGLINIAYTVTNPTNIKVQPPFVGVPSTNIPAATFPVNPFQLNAGGTFGITIAANTTSITPANFSVSLQGTNTKNQTFSGSNSVGFSLRNYWGFNANPALLPADIIALQSSQLKSGFAGNYTMPANAVTRYIYFAFDNSFGYPTTIFDVTNGFNVTADFQDLGTVVAPNQFGVSRTWRIIRSVNATAGAGGFVYALS